MKTKKNAATRAAPDCPTAGPTPEEIASCAHLVREQEGRPAGRDLDHWLQAEVQLRQNRRQDAPEKVADFAMETSRNLTRPPELATRPRYREVRRQFSSGGLADFTQPSRTKQMS